MPLIRAKNRDGEITAATDFAKGEWGTCEYCGAPVYRKISSCGLAYMALRDGYEHTHPTCKRLVKRKMAHTLTDFDLDQMLAKLRSDPPEEGPDVGLVDNPPDGEEVPGDTGSGDSFEFKGDSQQNTEVETPPESSYETDDGYERPCTNLQQIVEEDLLSDLTPGKLIHGKQAKNVFILPRFLPEALNTKDFQKGGSRIIDCRPTKVFEEKHSIHFQVNRKINGQWINGKFVVYFQNELTWKRYVEALFERPIEDNGTLGPWMTISNKRALIAANWTRSKCSFSYYTQYRSQKQICIYDK